jgi:hypothetical protein
LLNDEENLVKNEAIKTFSAIISLLSQEEIARTFAPIFVELYDTRHEDCLVNLTKYSG